jgi:hypothetical protein
MKFSYLTSLCVVFLSLGVTTAQAQTLVGRWTFDDPANPGADSVGNNHATIVGGQAGAVDGIGPGATPSRALRITGNRSHAVTQRSVLAAIGRGAYSVGLWVRYDGSRFVGHARHEHPITSNWGARNARALDVFAERRGDTTFFWGNGAGTQSAQAGIQNWVSRPNTWVHIVVGRSVEASGAATSRFCIDGREFTGTTQPAAFDFAAGTSPTYFGYNPAENGGRSFPGDIDDVQVYDGWVGPAGCQALTVAGAAVGVAPAAAGPTLPVAGRWYKLHTVFRGQNECLEGNQAGSPTHAGAAFMDRCQNVSGQSFSFEAVGGGFYRVRTQFRGQNECLEGNQSSSPVHAGSAFMDRCQNVSGQLWRLVPAGDGFRLQTQFRGEGECLEGNQASSSVHGGNAFMDRCQNVSGQIWTLEAL